MLNSFSEFWQLIVRSNTLNFLFFAGFIAYFLVKIDIKNLIKKLQADIVDSVEKSKLAKTNAIDELEKAKISAASIPAEIEKILVDAQKNADLISKKILEDARVQVEKIEQNTQKLIEADERSIMSDLVSRVSKEAVLLAETRLTEALTNDRQLHDKFIDNSLKELDRLKF